ncbi:MAG: hypothetical protein OXI56_08860 [bacterium]|nr:hypothetical protein [bacterium]
MEVRDQTHGVRLEIQEVRLEVEKVRSEMAKMDTGLSDRIGGVRLDVEKVRSEMTDQIGGLERSMSEQIQGVEKGLRAWMAIGVSLIAVLVTFDVRPGLGRQGVHRIRGGTRPGTVRSRGRLPVG